MLFRQKQKRQLQALNYLSISKKYPKRTHKNKKREEKHGSMQDPSFKSKSTEMEASPADLRTDRRRFRGLMLFLILKLDNTKKRTKDSMKELSKISSEITGASHP